MHKQIMLFGTLWLASTATSNNIQVSNTTLTDNTGTTANVRFDISWENSWRGEGVNNWDAAWVFVKYRTTGGTWHHVRLANTGHTAPAGSVVETGLLDPLVVHDDMLNPVLGVFMHRGVDGTGTFSAPGTQLRWNYGAVGINPIDIAEVQVFAIEMVYVPQGPFAAGSGGGETYVFTLTTISTDIATGAPSGSGLLGGQSGGYPTGAAAPDNASWPNGYAAFYCMKYEVSQQGYVDFLNTLTYAQQEARTASVPNSVPGTGALSAANANRNGIDLQQAGLPNSVPAKYACNLDGDATYGGALDGRDIACNFLSWGDLAAYLDWSGLRPMTELEFEKACRGTTHPVANEYPWGTTTTHMPNQGYTLANAGAADETIQTNYSTTVGNALHDWTEGALNGPVRVGIFSANASSTGRITAGASYYGIMEMGGNLYERTVSIGNTSGRLYTGNHGNGSLGLTGQHDAPTWPTGATAEGSGLRGGSWSVSASNMRVSDRLDAATFLATRSNMLGGRGVRNAP